MGWQWRKDGEEAPAWVGDNLFPFDSETDTNQTQKQGGDADNEDPSRVGLRQYWVGLRLGKIADWRQQFLGPMAELPDTIRGFWQNIIGLWKPK